MNRRLAPVLAVMLSVGGCSGNATPTAPSSMVSPAGNWSGSISDPVSGDGTARLSLAGSNATMLTGTWSATFRNGESFSGPAAASLDVSHGYGIVMYADPPPPCATGSGAGGSTLLGFTVINVVVTSSRLTAVSERLSCSGPSLSFGTLNLSKE